MTRPCNRYRTVLRRAGTANQTVSPRLRVIDRDTYAVRDATYLINAGLEDRDRVLEIS